MRTLLRFRRASDPSGSPWSEAGLQILRQPAALQPLLDPAKFYFLAQLHYCASWSSPAILIAANKHDYRYLREHDYLLNCRRMPAVTILERV